MIDINQLIRTGNNALLVVSTYDLMNFANAVFKMGVDSMAPARTEPYTREEAARVLHVSARTIDNWRREGVFGARCKNGQDKSGRRVLIPSEAVTKLLTNQ